MYISSGNLSRINENILAQLVNDEFVTFVTFYIFRPFGSSIHLEFKSVPVSQLTKINVC